MLDKASPKQEIAFSLWRKGVIVSTQVLMEFTNICLKKLKFSKQDAFENAMNLMEGAEVKSVTKESVSLSFQLALKYGFSHWDTLIVASALQAGCTILYTEDLQHGQVVDGKIKIVNHLSGINLVSLLIVKNYDYRTCIFLIFASLQGE